MKRALFERLFQNKLCWMKYKLMVRNGLEVYFGLSMPGDDRLNIGVKNVGLQFEYSCNVENMVAND
jgi:hypothetical protein